MSNRDAILAKVQSVILESTDVDRSKIHMHANLRDDLGADSLVSIEIVMALEDAFGVQITEAKAAEIRTVGDLIDAIISASSSGGRSMPPSHAETA